MDKHTRASNRYQIFRRGIFLGSVIAYPDYENRVFYTVSNYHHGALRFTSGDIFVNYRNTKFYITNVEKINYSYKLTFETDDDQNRYKRPQSWINLMSVKTASLNDLENLIPSVSRNDQSLLMDLISKLQKSIADKSPLNQHELIQFKELLKRNNYIAAKLAEILLKYLIE
ncbi:hypothetical protein [Lentilactobacillus farraginis]|nr:hypothetical protein [Lentilactobacillus farraginis]